MTANNFALQTSAELAAQKAEPMPAFHGLNLTHIRRQVALLLSMIGRDGIFHEYTVHDISHIDKMLNSLDWIVPNSTKAVMSPADWLMTVLAIYFHDLGMLVTAREFDARAKSDFAYFRDSFLFAGPDGKDYKAKVTQLPADRAERFLYQEFVRHKHAERVRAWVTGDIRTDLGDSADAAREIDSLLRPLGAQFRRDLGLICESHHLNDLDDTSKYKVSQPYGDSEEETVNLQYCAVLLRTADLLHITSDRTPSVSFKTINPVDPISQQEWAKQMAVKRLRPKPALNSEGVVDEDLPRDTVEVYAYFTEPNGFFGLTSYLAYAQSQLRMSNDWVVASRKQNQVKHEFPWRRIDDSHIEAHGFLPRSFEFTLDQARILDLLTGHTLYNDTRVVLRELVQNAIDAIRLYHHPNPPDANASVKITWNSKERMLTVIDNGTGMTQEIISNYLLKAGSSRYQDPAFKKLHPNFSSISRFGIGVLSAFMIADSLEVTTCSAEDEDARQLTLRSVHGKYLIRLLKKLDPAISHVFPHGTEMKLRVRPSVKVADIVETARLWVVVPGCKVSVRIDEGPETPIGFGSPREAVTSFLADFGVQIDVATASNQSPPISTGPLFRVIEEVVDDVRMAYAIRWNEHFKEWEFFQPPDVRSSEREEPVILGTCVEGIRVEMTTPGFYSNPIVAVANVTGSRAPKTNVARSGLEATAERDAMLRSVYKVYRTHIASEIDEMRKERGYSLSGALQEARYLCQSLMSVSSTLRPVSPNLLENALSQIGFLLIEEGGVRNAISPQMLAARDHFWTIDSQLLYWAESLIREVKSSASLSAVVAALNLSNYEFPDAAVICGIRPKDMGGNFAFSNREVDKIVLHVDQARVDLRWANTASPPRWMGLPTLPSDLRNHWRDETRRGRVNRATQILFAAQQIDIQGATDITAIRTSDTMFVLPETPVSDYLARAREKTLQAGGRDALACLLFVFLFVQNRYLYSTVRQPQDFVQHFLRNAEAQYLPPGRFESLFDLAELVKLATGDVWKLFDPSAGRRQADAAY